MGAVASEDLSESCFHGSFLCEEWELRLTRRCLEEDLGRSPETNLEDLLGVEIVKAFIARRRERHDNTREVAPLTSGRTVWRLSRGHDHRGATWYDPDEKVVWLLAYGRHRSGEPDDAFPYFKQLDSEDRLFPTLDDYTALENDRGRRFVEHVTRVVPPLMERAKDQPEVEQSSSIGGSAEIGVAMEVVETLEEVYLRVSPLNLRPAWLEIILAAVFGDRAWEVTDRFPNREPSVDELRFRTAEV